MYVDVSDDAFFVDHKNGPFRDTLCPENIVFQRNVTVWPEITQDGKRNIDPLAPCPEAGKVVCENTQDLGVFRRKEVLKFLISG